MGSFNFSAPAISAFDPPVPKTSESQEKKAAMVLIFFHGKFVLFFLRVVLDFGVEVDWISL
jgi:hypothetical protein